MKTSQVSRNAFAAAVVLISATCVTASDMKTEFAEFKEEMSRMMGDLSVDVANVKRLVLLSGRGTPWLLDVSSKVKSECICCA